MTPHLQMIKGILPCAYRFLCNYLHAVTGKSLACSIPHLLYVQPWMFRMFKSMMDLLLAVHSLTFDLSELLIWIDFCQLSVAKGREE